MSAEVIKLLDEFEAFFPPPAPFHDVDMGTFDAATGEFAGLTTIIIEPDEVILKPKKITPEIETSAQTVRLTFGVKNRGDLTVKLQVDGFTTFHDDDSATITVSSTPRRVGWRITVGTETFSDDIDVKEEPYSAMGTMEIPLLPIGINFDLPVSVPAESKVTYTFTKTHETKVKFTSKKSTTKETEAFPTFLAGVSELQDMVGKAITVAKVFTKVLPEDTLKKAGALNDAIGALFGSVDATETEETISATEEFLTLKTSETHVFSPPRNGGPGEGDQLRFIRSPKFVWVFVNGQLHLAILPPIETGLVNMKDVAAMKSFGWDDATIAEVQKLNPFLADPDAELEEDRFQRLLTLNGSAQPYKFTHTQDQLQGSTDTDTTIETSVVDKKSGLLVGQRHNRS